MGNGPFQLKLVAVTLLLAVLGCGGTGAESTAKNETKATRFYKEVSWIPRSSVSLPTLQPAGVQVQHGEVTSGGNYYVARITTRLPGTNLYGTFPGKQYGHSSRIFIGYGGREYCLSGHSLLVYTPGVLSWTPLWDTRADPEKWFVAGSLPVPGSSVSVTQYVCRTTHVDHFQLVVGRAEIVDGEATCKYPLIGREWTSRKFEVLIDNRIKHCFSCL